MSGTGKPTGEHFAGEKADAYLAGGIPRRGAENPVDFTGLAIFSGQKIVGTLNTQ